MISLQHYILESEDNENPVNPADIKFIIYLSDGTTAKWLHKDDDFSKIEYQYKDREEGLFIDFLLGKQDDVWQLWVGKIGSCTYDDDPYKSLDTKDFKKAINNSIDIIEDFVQKVLDDPTNYSYLYKEKTQSSNSSEDISSSEGLPGSSDEGGGLI